MSTESTLTDVNSALGTINNSLPILIAAYQGFKTIWITLNPGKTETDYFAYLASSSAHLITDSDAVLVSLGYAQAPNGSWSKP